MGHILFIILFMYSAAEVSGPDSLGSICSILWYFSSNFISHKYTLIVSFFVSLCFIILINEIFIATLNS